MADSERNTEIPPIFVVTGDIGSLGEHALNTVLAQYRGARVQVNIVRHTRRRADLEAVINRAAQTRGTIVHTLTNPEMRSQMVTLAEENRVVAIDLIGPLMERLTQIIGLEPIGRPGLYREMNQAYFQRMQAIDYTLAHDDGRNHQGWKDAEIVLIGPSRVGKTPLSIYLSILGWKVANVPLVPGIPPRQELWELERRRVIGLKIDPVALLEHRQFRQRGLGTGSNSDYNNPIKVHEEIEEVRQIFRKGRFKVIDVTSKPIETTAGQVIRAVKRHIKSDTQTFEYIDPASSQS